MKGGSMYRNLNAECARVNVTRKELAKKALKIQPTTLSNKLKDDNGLKLAEAKKIKEYLHTDLSLDELFMYEEA